MGKTHVILDIVELQTVNNMSLNVLHSFVLLKPSFTKLRRKGFDAF
jgi:hypothetical protein